MPTITLKGTPDFGWGLGVRGIPTPTDPLHQACDAKRHCRCSNRFRIQGLGFIGFRGEGQHNLDKHVQKSHLKTLSVSNFLVLPKRL